MEADNPSSSGCVCLEKSSDSLPNPDVNVSGSVVTAEYGWGCVAHDEGKGDCENGTHDWCSDMWCIVNESSCEFKTREVTYTLADDYFSYETCNSNFTGNSWVG